MAPQEDLDRFLSDLSVRRVRLLELVGSEAAQNSMADELSELGEQLLVADEELRVQQEELEDSRRQLEVFDAERTQLFQSATEAWVLTDERGLVLRSTRAAEQLSLQPPGRLTPRPIATWFMVSDRSLIRRMIGRRDDSETQVLDHALLQRSDSSTVPVRVNLTRTVGGPGERNVLRWELVRLDRPTPTLRVVPTRSEPAVTPADGPSHLAVGLAKMVGRLSERQPLTAAWSTVLAAGLELVPMADHAGLVLFGRRDPGQPAASSDRVAAIADVAQLELGGPLTVSLSENRPARLDDTGIEGPWPGFATRAAPLGIRSVLTVPLTLPSHLARENRAGPGAEQGRPGSPTPAEHRVGALSLYAHDPHAFDDDDEIAASLMAAHAAAALFWLKRDSNLQDALVSRQLIGEAVGILIERQKLTSAAAFDVLVRRSQNANLKLRELARIVVETGQDPADITAS